MSDSLAVALDDRCSGVLHGVAEAASGAPLLVCIHGGGCHGGYFDVAKRSTLKLARERGMAVLLVNRPGHGGNATLAGESPILEGTPMVGELIAQVRDAYAPGSPLLLLGHSIGGAVALTLAAQGGTVLPIRAVAVSGIGDVSPLAPQVPTDFAPGRKEAPPGPLTSELFFGPVGSFGWDAVARLRRAAEPWVLAEISEVVHRWPDRWRALAPTLTLPIHLRIAEFETIWETGVPAAERLDKALIAAPRADVAVAPGGGHLYELHHRGPELVADQLDFFAAAL